ncbi:hypothetical protein BH23ACI1_BH23ACI1_08500 [soil metagenome]
MNSSSQPPTLHGTPTADLLPELHRQVLAATGGLASVLLQRDVRSGGYRASSGRGFSTLEGAWVGAEFSADFAAAALEGPTVRPLAALPGLADRLEGHEVLIVPLVEDGGTAFLLVTGVGFSASAVTAAARARTEFSLALRVTRLTKRQTLFLELQGIFRVFTRGVTATRSLRTSLDALALDTNALFGTRQVAIWLHDRGERTLSLAGCSDAAWISPPVAAHAADPPARGLRLERPRLDPAAGTVELLAPLRGWRRALGTVVIEGAPGDLDDGEYLDIAHELARQLSSAIENVQLVGQLLQHHRLLEDTFNSLADLVVVVDTQQRVVQTNEAFAARVEAPRTGLLREPFDALVGEDLASWVSRAEPGEGPAAVRTRQFTSEQLDGVFAATVTPLLNQHGQSMGQVVVMRDITAQTLLEREQAALRARLAQSEKLASLGQFVAGIAHEMNNPLQGVLGHLELLMTTSEAARPLRPTLKRIYQEGDRAAKIVRNLLVFAGSRRMARRRVRIERVLARAVASRAAALRRAHITVVRRVPEEIPAISGDPSLLQQAFLNILINAEHAVLTPRAGEGAAPGRIEITVSRTDTGAVRTAIRDTGPGIPGDLLPRIFDPFFTTKDVGAGTGLGLTITYGIIQEHGGSILAANAPEGGAILTIDLPAFAPGGASARQART